MELEIQNKHALITGGGQGIGRQIALTLAAEGVSVTVLGRKQAKLESVCAEIQALGGQAGFVVFDLASSDLSPLNEALTRPVDIFVGNAAKPTIPKKLTHMDETDWYQTIEVDLNGTYRLLRACLPTMQAQQWGRVILIGSLSGMVGVSAYPAYCTVKAAYEGLVKNLAVDYSKYGITVNLVSPALLRLNAFKKPPRQNSKKNSKLQLPVNG
jgi:NAD(P)-dependent dehydrogenase (short-subunit alcohol dehydrogenase family)